MISLFISISFFDVIDIIIVAFLLYQLYMLIRGTIAINIFVGILVLYFLWLIVAMLKMNLLNSIIGQFMSVGFIALIIVFQQEIRRFLLILGTQDFFKRETIFNSLLNRKIANFNEEDVNTIVYACTNMSATKTGALIVITHNAQLKAIVKSGDVLNANLSARLIENIFFKNSPLHDGAIVIHGAKIIAARCILPITNDSNVPATMGTRHRAAIGITEAANVLAVVVSEETGNMSVFKSGERFVDVEADVLRNLISEYLKII